MTAFRIKQRRETAKNARPSLANHTQSAAIAPGTIIGGTCKIESIIGAGGMGTVYLAKHLTLQRQFALKILAPDLVSEQYWLRFQTEAKTLAALNHPNLVNVYDLGIDDKSVFYYSMDYLHGANLEDILASEGPQTLEQTIEIYLAVLDGLAYAHRHGIVHRDIKPANIFISQSADGKLAIKILDFGIAKLVDGGGSQQQLTAAGEIFGSPYYMSPEQCMGGTVDTRSDIYSVGCSIFETLTGFVPFESKSAVEIGLMHQEQQPPLLSEVDNQFPSSMDQVIEKCLAKLPRDRYQSARELSLDLERIKAGKDLSAYKRPAALDPVKFDLENNSKFAAPATLVAISTVVLIAIAMSLNSILFKAKPTPRVTVARDEDKTFKTVLNEIISTQTPSPVAEKIKKFLQSKPGFYSSIITTNGKKQKLFNFPKTFTVGSIRFKEDGATKIFSTLENCVTPLTSVDFTVYTNAAQFPQLLRYFRQDDLHGIFVVSGAAESKPLVAEILKFPALQALSMGPTDVGNKDLQLLQKMKNLTALNILSEELDVQSFSRNTVLPQLENFTLSFHGSITPILQVLSQNKNLQAVELKNEKLTKADFVTIAKCKKLGALSLINIPISNADMEQLTTLPNLKLLYVTDFRWNSKCVEVLKKFKNLEMLTLPQQFVDDPIIKTQIKLALPHLKKLESHVRAEIY